MRYSGYKLYAFLTRAQDGGEWYPKSDGRSTSEEQALGRTGGWVSLRAGLEAMAERKIYCPCR
jgi:hypothetical protein